MTVIAVVPAAGTGERLGAAVPKAFVRVGGRELLLHAVDRLFGAGVDRIVVAVSADQLESARALLRRLGDGRGRRRRPDGLGVARRWPSSATMPTSCWCMTQRGRFAPESLVRSVVDAVRAGAPAVVPVLPVVDTIRSVAPDGSLLGTVDRDQLRVVQTPQGFAPAVLRRAHLAAESGGRSATDDAGLVESIGVQIRRCPATGRPSRSPRPTICWRRSG